MRDASAADTPPARRSRPPGSICARILGLLALGFLTTLAIAWLAALFIHVPGDVYAVTPTAPLKARQTFGWRMLTPDEERTVGLSGRAIGLTRYDRFASTYYSINLLTVAGTGAREEMERTRGTPESVVGPLARTIILPWTCGRRAWPPNDAYAHFSLRGWPLRAFSLEYEQIYPPQNTLTGVTLIHGGLRVKFNDPTSVWYAPPPSPTALPYRPIWPGLIFDTVAFALAWFALLSGFASARRSWRARKGRCTHCRYDLRATPPASPCPECGRTRTA